MQLKNKKNLKKILTTATCTLLGTAVQADVQAEDNSGWQFDTALMYYGESDRVTAVEGIISGTQEFEDEHFLNLKLTVDTLTGSSANGATPQPVVQTFTRPSGNGQYTTPPSHTPLDDTFRDTRVQLNGQWTQPLNDNYSTSFGGQISKEYDYLSLSVNASLARDFNKKNTTLSVGGSYAYDTIEPEGGIPKPFSAMVIDEFGTPEFQDAFDATRIASDDTKKTMDLLIGLTQVINRRMLMQFNYSYSSADGYMTDPFKILSVVDNNGHAQEYLYEHRPDERTKQSFYWQTKYHFDLHTVDFSYRFMTDDWEIDSHTFDLHYFIPLANGHYVEPHIRYYTQTEAEFYRPFLMDAEALPNYASADYRIGEMDAYTVGVKYGLPLDNANKLSFRLEYYSQSPTNAGFAEPGVLANEDLYESVDAIIAQVSYSF